jgi:type IV pilus assembly protein PilQ
VVSLRKGLVMRSSMMKYKRLKFLTVLAFIMAAYAITVAENGDEDSKQKEVWGPAEQGPSTALEQRLQKTISIDFRNTPIEDVIRIMAEQADVDIITSPNVIGNVTATLTNVPLGEALSNILAAHGYGCVIDKNMIRIAPLGEIAQKDEILESRVYRITYADITEVEKALQKFISKRGSLSSNKGTSNIIVTDTESTIKAIDTFIGEIDRMTPQVLVEVRIYDITTDENYDLGIEWNAGRNSTERETLDPTTGTYTGVLIPDSTSFGVGEDSTPGDITKAAGARGTTTRTSSPFVAGSYDESTGGSIRLGLLNDAVDIDIALNILHEQDFAKLLANPRIMVLDNEKATFEIIREIPYTEQTTTAAGSDTQPVKFKNVGVKLEVTPHVTREGMVRLQIQPEFGVRVGTTSPPTVDTRKVDTIALVKDNQTVVLGGLRKNQTTQDTWKIPILGDIPLAGGLFRSETESIEINELLIFITPKIILKPTLSPRELETLEKTKVPPPRDPTLTLD